MNINDIVLRDMMDEEERNRREEARKSAAGIRKGRRLVRVADVVFWTLTVALMAFLAWCIVSDAAHVFKIISR